jgi:hypothetical protein
MNLKKLELGGGKVESVSDGWRLILPAGKGYADAQLDDTADAPREGLAWRPPLRFSLRARTSGPEPFGTFGFGFWNDPFTLSLGLGGAARRWPAMPQTAWFFYLSPPGDLVLDPAAPGTGWKAATLASRRLPPWLLAPLAAGGALLLAAPLIRRPAYSWAQKFFRAREAALAVDPSQWHEYVIEWRETEICFRVDGRLALHATHPPRPPLGLVLWIDNQYAVASPQRGFGFGVLPLAQSQWLEVAAVQVESPWPA